MELNNTENVCKNFFHYTWKNFFHYTWNGNAHPPVSLSHLAMSNCVNLSASNIALALLFVWHVAHVPYVSRQCASAGALTQAIAMQKGKKRNTSSLILVTNRMAEIETRWLDSRRTIALTIAGCAEALDERSRTSRVMSGVSTRVRKLLINGKFLGKPFTRTKMYRHFY